MSETDITSLRDEIDAIDLELLQLLARRDAVSGRVRLAKAGDDVKLRPGREADILRALLAANDGGFPERSLLRIWREIFSASLASQGAYSTAVLTQDGGSLLWDQARDHFGAGGTFHRCATPRRVLEAVAAGEDTLGILPLPAPEDSDPWWQHLLVQPNSTAGGSGAPQIIAKLPFWTPAGDNGNSETAVVIAMMAPDPSGRDRTFLAIDLAGEVSANRLTSALGAAGIDAALAARWHETAAPERWVNLIDMAGFADADDARFSALTDALEVPVNQILRLGCFAAPSVIETKGRN
jgi:chorismate mutase